MITGNNDILKRNVRSISVLLKAFTIGFLLLGLGQTALAQQDPHPKWKSYTDIESVNTVEKESNSLWIGTNSSGLVKLNTNSGERFFYDASNSKLPSNEVTDLVIDKNNNKWISTDEGLVRYNGDKWKVFDTSSSGLPGNNINTITVDGNGNKWIGTLNGVAKFDGSNWKVFKKSNSGLPWNEIFSLASNNGIIWVGTGFQGLAKYDGSNWKVFDTYDTGIPGDHIQAITIDGNGNKWIGTSENGLARYDGSTWKVFNKSNSDLPDNSVQALLVSESGNKWIGTRSGLAKLSGNSWNIFNEDNNVDFPNDDIQGIVKSGDDMWVGIGTSRGTEEGGLVHNNGSNWSRLNLPSNEINNITITSNGNVWICTSEGLAKSSNRVTWNLVNVPADNSFRSKDIERLIIDKSGNKWVGVSRQTRETQQGYERELPGRIAIYKGGDWSFFKPFNTDNNIKCIAKQGSNIWVGASQYFSSTVYTGGGLAKYNGNSWQKFDASSTGLPSKSVTSITVDQNGDKWIGTAKGLAKFNGNTWSVYDTANSKLPYNAIKRISIDKSGNKWIGTAKGLAKFNGSSWQVYDTSNSALPDNFVQSLFVADNGHKWIGTTKGLTQYDGNNWENYNTENSGLLNESVTSISLDGKGNLWVGTNSGLAVYDEEGFKSGKFTKRGSEISLKVYPNPTQNQFKLKTPTQAQTYTLHTLTGKKAQSGKLNGEGTHTVNVSNLSAGVYLLEVKGRDAVRTKKVVIE